MKTNKKNADTKCNMKKKCFCVFAAFIFQGFFTMRIEAQNNGIVVTGNWIASVDAGHLEYGPGSDLNGILESAENQVLVEVDKQVLGDIVYVHRQDIFWHSNLSLWARRTGGNARDGEDYREIDGSSRYFFSGRPRKFNAYIQYQVRGLSVTVSPGTYSATVVYTVTNQ